MVAQVKHHAIWRGVGGARRWWHGWHSAAELVVVGVGVCLAVSAILVELGSELVGDVEEIRS